ncbi:MAG: hypothetical protein GXO93_08390 [FCB group bacterium]|nr:hypothetical protein [FCB group bacterium]
MGNWNFEFSIDINVKNHILFSKIYGLWKLETAEAYCDEFKKVVKPLLNEPWAKLIDLTNWKTSYPEVNNVIGDLNRWCRAHKMKWAVYIIDNPVSFPHLMQMFDSGEYRDIARTFRTRAEAEKFLKEQGFDLRTVKGEQLFK